jgi:thymidylate synthase (FAD)
MAMTKVLDHGEIRLLEETSASDLSIARSARVLPDAEWRGKPDERLLKFMLKNDHTSPFEHGYLKFYVDAPMFVLNQWVRHRTWSFNLQSGRYEDEGQGTKFYIPKVARLQDDKNRQNSIPTGDEEANSVMRGHIGLSNEDALLAYQFMRSHGIAREMARLVMPENKYQRMIASVDPHNFMHFLYLRMHKDAQWEIRQYAQAAYMLWKDVMPVTASIWTEINADRIGLND